MGAFKRLPVGRTCGTSSRACNKRTPRRSPVRLWNESQLCMPLRKKFADALQTSGNRFATYGPGPCSNNRSSVLAYS